MSDNNANDNAAPEDNRNGPDQESANDGAADAAGADDAPEKQAWEKGPEAQIEALAAEAADLKDRLLRTMAEMENVRRRADREREEARKYAVTAFARDMLAVGDNMNRAIQSIGADARAAADDTIKTLIEGVEMTEREMLNVFERHGITKIEPKGEKFDPNFHQAMFEVENPEVAAGTVVEVVAPGYVIGERVLRPAMVGVSKGGPKAAARPEGGAEETAPAPDSGTDAQASADAHAAAESHKKAADSKGEEPAGKTIDRSA